MRNSKGFSLITLVFVVVVVVIGGIAWYMNNSISGQGISREILENFKLQKVELENENSILYLEQALWDSTANASQTVSDLAGRNVTNETDTNLTYWRCDLDEVSNSGREVTYQIPSIERVQLSLQNKTMTYLENILNQLHGIRDGVIYDVGGVKCAEVGYNTPLDSPLNSKYKTAGIINKIDTTFESYKRERANLTFNDDIRYNRFWYMYTIMARWTQEQDMESDILSEMAKVYDWVDDVVCTPSCTCPCPYQPLCTRIPINWSTLVRHAVDKGIEKGVNELESGSRYFNDNKISCGYGIEIDYYDNIPYITNARIGRCGSWGQWCLMYCRLDYEYNFEGDIDISCTDQQYQSIPRKDLERLNWKIRFNVEATDPPNEGPFPPPCDSLLSGSCKTIESPDRLGTDKFPECTVTDPEFKLCDTGVDTIGTLWGENNA